MNQTVEATGTLLAAGGSASGGPNFMMIGLLLVVVILMFVLPARQRRKMQAQMQERQQQMVPGTRVMAQNGIFGTVVSTDQTRNTMDVEIAQGLVVTMYRPAVTTVLDENGMVPGTPEAQQFAVSQARADAESGSAASTEGSTAAPADAADHEATTGTTPETSRGTLNGEPMPAQDQEPEYGQKDAAHRDGTASDQR